jgi:hypothetical protein
MVLALGATAIVALALSWLLAAPRLLRWIARLRTRLRARRRGDGAAPVYDRGRELRAEQRARALLRSCVNAEEWEMYRDLGILRVWGRDPEAPAAYAYLIYPHEPIVAYRARDGRPLNEYCIAFPDHSRPYGSARLPDSDDVLAKWMALTADERGTVAAANMHLAGRQVAPARVRRDLARLAAWEAGRGRGRATAHAA